MKEEETEVLPEGFKIKTLPNGSQVIYTDQQAPGAISNGSEVIKQNSEEGDSTPNGTIGVVIGSLENPLSNQPSGQHLGPVKHLYFVRWETRDFPIGVIDLKIRKNN